jgi:hypothetical protein
LVKGTEFTRLMDEISLTVLIGRLTEHFRQKRGGQLKGPETVHLRSQEDGLNADVNYHPCVIPTPAVKSSLILPIINKDR